MDDDSTLSGPNMNLRRGMGKEAGKTSPMMLCHWQGFRMSVEALMSATKSE